MVPPGCVWAGGRQEQSRRLACCGTALMPRKEPTGQVGRCGVCWEDSGVVVGGVLRPERHVEQHPVVPLCPELVGAARAGGHGDAALLGGLGT
jgi:hypothetical protein